MASEGRTLLAHRVEPSGEADPRPLVPETYPAVFQATAARVPDRVALRTAGNLTQLTWAQYAGAVERVAGALAGLGVGRGDRVALMSRNRPDLAVVDVGVMHLGAATVALYAASPPRTIEDVVRDCAPRALIVEQALVGRLDGATHELPHVVSLETLDALPHAIAVQLPGSMVFCR